MSRVGLMHIAKVCRVTWFRQWLRGGDVLRQPRGGRQWLRGGDVLRQSRGGVGLH